jgi:hypothetical protein
LYTLESSRGSVSASKWPKFSNELSKAARLTACLMLAESVCALIPVAPTPTPDLRRAII